MSTENAKIKIRNRTVEIKWISEYCDHILSSYIHRNSDHDLTFLQISQLVKKCDNFTCYKGRTWYAHNILNGTKYRVVFILTTKFT